MRHTLAFFILILVFISACQQQEKTDWDLIIDETGFETAYDFWGIYEEISLYSESSKVAQECISKIDILMRIRNSGGINLYDYQKIREFNFVDLNEYLDSIKSYATAHELIHFQFGTELLVEEARTFLQSYQKSGDKEDLFLFLNTSFVAEKRLLQAYLGLFKEGHEFYVMDFNYHLNPETKSKVFKMILTMKPAVDSKTHKVEIDSVKLTRNGVVILDDYKFEKLGGAVYIEYHPIQSGLYSIAGNYHVFIPNTEWDMKERFEANWVVE